MSWRDECLVWGRYDEIYYSYCGTGLCDNFGRRRLVFFGGMWDVLFSSREVF